MALLVKSGVPVDWTLWGRSPVLVQVHVTVPPAATVSTAWFVDPLCALLKKMLPTMTAAVCGAGPGAGAGSGSGFAGSVGVSLPEQPAISTRPAAVKRRLIMSSPLGWRDLGAARSGRESMHARETGSQR